MLLLSYGNYINRVSNREPEISTLYGEDIKYEIKDDAYELFS